MSLVTTDAFVGHLSFLPDPGYHGGTSTGSTIDAAFDAALLFISDCLTDAEGLLCQGHPREARLLFRRAEIFAILFGYDELIRLTRLWKEQRLEMRRTALPNNSR